MSFEARIFAANANTSFKNKKGQLKLVMSKQITLRSVCCFEILPIITGKQKCSFLY